MHEREMWETTLAPLSLTTIVKDTDATTSFFYYEAIRCGHYPHRYSRTP